MVYYISIGDEMEDRNVELGFTSFSTFEFVFIQLCLFDLIRPAFVIVNTVRE